MFYFSPEQKEATLSQIGLQRIQKDEHSTRHNTLQWDMRLRLHWNSKRNPTIIFKYRKPPNLHVHPPPPQKTRNTPKISTDKKKKHNLTKVSQPHPMVTKKNQVNHTQGWQRESGQPHPTVTEKSGQPRPMVTENQVNHTRWWQRESGQPHPLVTKRNQVPLTATINSRHVAASKW